MTATFCPPDLSERPFALIVEREMTLSPEAIFAVWTQQFDRWFAAPGTLLMVPEVNAPFFFEAHFDGRRFPHYGRFLRLERNQLIELTWLTAATLGAETILTIELAPRDTGTHLRLTHAGFPNAELRDEHEVAWPGVLAQFDEQPATATRP